MRRWQGNPTAFRIDGQTRSGIPWILTSGNRDYAGPGWTVEMVLRFPMLGGETDLAVLPRTGEKHGAQLVTSPLPPAAESRIAAFSRTLASTVGFLEGAQELPTGFPPFDAVYRVLALVRQIDETPVDPALAGRILKWPAGCDHPAFSAGLAGFLRIRVPGSVAGTTQLGDRVLFSRHSRGFNRANSPTDQVARSTKVCRSSPRSPSEMRIP